MSDEDLQGQRMGDGDDGERRGRRESLREREGEVAMEAPLSEQPARTDPLAQVAPPAQARTPTYLVYILTCEDGSLYTGITTDATRRITEHLSGNGAGARYTRAHRPIELSALWRVRGRAAASSLEYRIKRLSHTEKQTLVDSPERLMMRFGKDVPDDVDLEVIPDAERMAHWKRALGAL